MSLSIFIKIQCSFEELINGLEKTLDAKFIKEERDCLSYYLSTLGLTIRVTGDLDYEDEMGIPFSKYSYQISIDMYTRVKQQEYWERLEYYMTMYIYSRICEKLKWKCIVVEDMQMLLAEN